MILRDDFPNAFVFFLLTYQVLNPENPITEKVLFHPMTPKPCSRQQQSVEERMVKRILSQTGWRIMERGQRGRKGRNTLVRCVPPHCPSLDCGQMQDSSCERGKGGGCGSLLPCEAHEDTIFQLFLHYTCLDSSSRAVLLGSQSPSVCFPELPKVIGV